MISSKGVVKLLDFGIAKNTDTTSADYTQTGTAQSMGTPMYMSPEQIKSTKDVTAQSDIYSLGVVLWQMVTGKKPYDTNTTSTFELQTKIVNEPLPLSGTFWDEVIGSATEKKTELRFHSILNIAERIKNPKESKLDFDTTQLFHQLNDVTETVVTNQTESFETVIDYNILNPKKESSNLFKAPFSFKGRIRRKEYGLSILIVSTVGIPLCFIIIGIIPVCWFIWSQGAKRAHDLGQSGWLQLIPFYSLLLLFAEGERHNNKYGQPVK